MTEYSSLRGPRKVDHTIACWVLQDNDGRAECDSPFRVNTQNEYSSLWLLSRMEQLRSLKHTDSSLESTAIECNGTTTSRNTQTHKCSLRLPSATEQPCRSPPPFQRAGPNNWASGGAAGRHTAVVDAICKGRLHQLSCQYANDCTETCVVHAKKKRDAKLAVASATSTFTASVCSQVIPIYRCDTLWKESFWVAYCGGVMNWELTFFIAMHWKTNIWWRQKERVGTKGT